MQMFEVKEVRNSKGQGVLLSPKEYALSQVLQEKFDRELRNSLGFELNITTLTAISKRVVEQKFFTLAPADYMPVRVGEGAWSAHITTYRDFAVAGDFESGMINLAADNARLATATSAIDSLSINVNNWAKEINWSIPELQMASKSGNWDVVTSKEKSRKRNWDLGIQKIAFLGSASDTSILGLLSQSTVNSNTAIITKKISSMSDAEFQTFVATILEAYRANSNRTVMPTHFIIPEGDYNGLTTPVNTNAAFGGSKLEYLEKAFKTATQNSNFKILPCAYADQTNNSLSLNRYMLLNYDEDSIRMDIPVDYTNTQQNSINGFQFSNVGYGQFTGVLAYRPLEALYFDYAN